MAQIQIELFPVLFGVGAYAIYRLIARLATPQVKDEDGYADKCAAFVINAGFDANATFEASPCAEPDQEPSPVAEASQVPYGHAHSQLPIRSAAAIFGLIAVAAACSSFHLQASVQVEDIGVPAARKGIRMTEKWRNKSREVDMSSPETATVPASPDPGVLAVPANGGEDFLSVKLTRQKVDNEQAEEDFVRSAYYGTLMVGTPPEPFTVVFDTGSGHLVLPSTYCKSETCRVHKRYRRSTSTTGKDINHDGQVIDAGKMRDQISVSFGTGEVTGVFVEDVVCVQHEGDTTEKNTTCLDPSTCALEGGIPEHEADLPEGCVSLRFIAATELSEDPFKDFQFDGILGLGLDGLSQTREFNFLDVVAKSVSARGSSDPHTFGVFLGNNAVEDSEIALGGWAAKHLLEDLAWSPVPDPEMGHWLVSIKAIRVGNDKLDFCDDGACKAAVDTGTSLLATPTAIFPELYEHLKYPAPLTGHCTGAGPLLHFELEEFTVTLGPRDYARAEKTGFQNPKPSLAKPKAALPYRRDLRCNPMLMTLDLPEPLGPKLFILGEPVLRKYYTAYDGKGKRIGFGRARHMTAPTRDELLVKAGVEGPSTRAPTMFDFFRWRKNFR